MVALRGERSTSSKYSPLCVVSNPLTQLMRQLVLNGFFIIFTKHLCELVAVCGLCMFFVFLYEMLTLVGLMITEIPFDASRVKQFTWPLTIDTDIEFDTSDHSLRSMWYAHQLCNNALLTDTTKSMNDFRRELYDQIVGKCLEHIIEDNFSFCPVCSFDGNTAIRCGRCNQAYHSACVRGVDIESFVCTV